MSVPGFHDRDRARELPERDPDDDRSRNCEDDGHADPLPAIRLGDEANQDEADRRDQPDEHPGPRRDGRGHRPSMPASPGNVDKSLTHPSLVTHDCADKDGQRIIAVVEDGHVVLVNRRGLEATATFPGVGGHGRRPRPPRGRPRRGGGGVQREGPDQLPAPAAADARRPAHVPAPGRDARVVRRLRRPLARRRAARRPSASPNAAESSTGWGSRAGRGRRRPSSTPLPPS